MVMTTKPQGGRPSTHLAKGRLGQEAAVSLTWPTGLARNSLSYRPRHSWVLWGTFLSLVAGWSWVPSRAEFQGRVKFEKAVPFPKGCVETVNRCLARAIQPGSLRLHPPKT